MALDVKNGIVFRIVQNEHNFSRILFKGAFDVGKDMPEYIGGKRVEAIYKPDVIWNDIMFSVHIYKLNSFLECTMKEFPIFYGFPVERFRKLYTDTGTVEPVICIKTKASKSAPIVEKGILFCDCQLCK